MLTQIYFIKNRHHGSRRDIWSIINKGHRGNVFKIFILKIVQIVSLPFKPKKRRENNTIRTVRSILPSMWLHMAFGPHQKPIPIRIFRYRTSKATLACATVFHCMSSDETFKVHLLNVIYCKGSNYPPGLNFIQPVVPGILQAWFVYIRPAYGIRGPFLSTKNNPIRDLPAHRLWTVLHISFKTSSLYECLHAFYIITCDDPIRPWPTRKQSHNFTYYKGSWFSPSVKLVQHVFPELLYN